MAPDRTFRPERLLLPRAHFEDFLGALRKIGEVIGPTLRGEAIALGPVRTVADLPIGKTARREPASHRLEDRGDGALFGYTVGADSWKRWLFPPRQILYRVRREGRSARIEPEPHPVVPRVFLGVRACDLAAIAILDKVYLGSQFRDAGYEASREGLFVVGVDCTEPAGTCFCVSMKTGPRHAVDGGADLVLTELVPPASRGEHRFVVTVASESGRRALEGLALAPASEADLHEAEAATRQAQSRMGRTLETEGLKELLYRNAENPHWKAIAQRCLTCTNCTMACPTCFCSTVEDSTSLDGTQVTRTRRWDSCFTTDFSYIHGGPVRRSPMSRYRQWMTHKLASWVDQFGTFGCVGCGRCIEWCPVGIDLTEEARAIHASDLAAVRE